MLITDDKLLVESAEKHNSLFKVPVCSIKSGGNASNALAELDHKTSENKIGEIVNLSQKLNSLIWDKLNGGASLEDILSVYEDVCKLGRLYMALRSADEKEREVIYERIQDEKAERDSKVSRWLTSPDECAPERSLF